MQPLRKTYSAFQSDAYEKRPALLTTAGTSKSKLQADIEVKRIQENNDFQKIEQAIFYKEKFEALDEITKKYEDKKMPKDLYMTQVRDLLAKDFAGVSVVQSKLVEKKRGNEPLSVPAVSGHRSKTKSPLKQFFDEQQMKNSQNKVVFSSLLSRQETPIKYGLKSTLRSPVKNNSDNNEFQLRRLKQQNERLRSQLDTSKSVYSSDDRLRQLRSQISQLSEENHRLKVEVSSRSGPRTDFVPEEEYDPYNIKVRENNIMRINTRNLSMSEKSSQYGEEYRGFKGERVYYDNQSELARSDFTHNPMNYSVRKVNFAPENDMLNSSHSTIQTQFLNLDHSELHDEEKYNLCREKIAFFKKSMVLYKSADFDIAFKRSDLNTELDRLRLILYVNNKLSTKVDCQVRYNFEREDFDIQVKKRLERVQARGQGREEIQITLRNTTELGNLIVAQVFVGAVKKKVILPALFIDFDSNYRLQFENVGYIERNLAEPLTIIPMSQFSTFQTTSNILELIRDYDSDRHTVAKLYGRSKGTKGIVRLTWKGDKLRIETCKEWRTLIGYLLLNAEDSISYSN